MEQLSEKCETGKGSVFAAALFNTKAREHPFQARSSALSSSFVLFVPFVVKQFYTSVRVLAFDPFSLVTHSE